MTTLATQRPSQVTITTRALRDKVNLIVAPTDSAPSTAFALLGNRAGAKTCIRIAGDGGGMCPQDQEEMLDFFNRGFDGFRGVLFSGPTEQGRGGAIDPMVIEIPAAIVKSNPEAVALGTLPGTAVLTLRGESYLRIDEWEQVANPRSKRVIIVQRNSDDTLDADGELPYYHQQMEQWENFGGFDPVGLVAWNGGTVTEKEIFASARRGWPTILIRGSGGAADRIADKLENGEAELLSIIGDNHHLTVVDLSNPADLRMVIKSFGFLK